MIGQSVINRIAALALAGIVGIGFYFNVPPPHRAHAFEAQSTWGGAGGGSANAQTIALANVQSLNDVLGVELRYVPSADNTGPATVSINGLTATAVRRPTNIGLQALSGGELQAGVTMTVMYNGSTIEIRGPVDMTPIGKSVEYRGSATPRGTLVEDGSCVSRTTYAPLFSVIGTNFGACDGTTTFGLPFSNGRSFVALDNQGSATANVVTSAGSGCNATAVGVCGLQNHAITASESAVLTYSTVYTTTPQQLWAQTTIPNVATTSGSPALSGSTQINLPIPGVMSTTSNAGGNPHSILNPISLGRRAIKF